MLRIKQLLTPLALLCLSFSAAAEPVAQVQTQPGYYRLMVGGYEITALSDGTNVMPMDKLLARVSPQDVTRLLAANDLTAPVETSINAFLINTGTHLALVDAGNGRVANPKVGKVRASLEAAGYRPEQVDTVLMTHLHGDHFGGLLHDGKLAYPNATVYVSQQDSDFWLNPQQVPADRQAAVKRAQDVFAPIKAAGKLKTFSGAQTLLPGIVSVPAPGHTPGHTAFMVENGGQKLLIWGDIVHAEAVQMALPATTISFDSSQDQAAKTRATLLAQAAQQGYWVAGAHLPFPGIGHVKAQGDAYRWVPANYSLAGLR